MKAKNILETIGNTPHIRLSKLFPTHEVWIKSERGNPGGSIKDRIALSMIEDAEKEGILKENSVIIEPTSGNTGIGLAMVAAVKGYRLILVMPESMSSERRKLMSSYGASFELTPKEKGMAGAVEKAKQMANEIPGSWIPSQFDNPSNIAIHKKITAAEILRDFPEGIDYLVSGIGTGGHLTGVGEALKQKFLNMKVFAVEPELSPVLSGGKPSPHPIQGIGANFIPENFHRSVIDGIITVSKEESYKYTRLLSMKEGLLAGISTGASLAAIAKHISQIPAGSTILTFAYDTGERYLSIEGLL